MRNISKKREGDLIKGSELGSHPSLMGIMRNDGEESYLSH